MYTLPNRPFGNAISEVPADSRPLEQAYLDYLYHIYCHGTDKADRTGTGTRSIFGYMMRFNLQRGLPLLTTKFVPQKTIFDELKWFLEGSTNNNRLREINQMHSKLDWSQKDTIWTEWEGPNGELGPVYGWQWRNWPGRLMELPVGDKDAFPLQFEKYFDGHVLAHPGYDSSVYFEGIDQVQNAINALTKSPDSRRIIISAWNPTYVDQMALPPCHALYQFYTRPMSFEERYDWYVQNGDQAGDDYHNLYLYQGEDVVTLLNRNSVPTRRLDCMLYQRSADSFLGVPFNIASYAMLTFMFAHQCNMAVGEFIWVGGDCHIYSNHFKQVEEQLSRTPYAKSAQLKFNRRPNSIFEYDWLDLSITGYEHQGKIEAPVAK